MFKLSRRFTFTALGVFASVALAQASAVFNFDADTPFTATTFTDMSGGISATFSSTVPGAFVIDPPGLPTSFVTLSGNTLAEPGPAGLDDQALTITFSPDINSFSVVFAVNSVDPTPFNLAAFRNGVPVGTASATEAAPAVSNLPEGTLTFTAPDFNAVVLSTSAPDFAIDDLVVAAVAPEPGTFSLLLFVVAGVTCFLLVRNRRIANQVTRAS